MEYLLRIVRLFRISVGVVAFLFAGIFMEANPASVEEAAWFAGEWEVGAAPVERFETIYAGEPNISVIKHLEGANIEREITLKGRLYVMQFEVRNFGGNFPWWGDNGGNYVSKKVDDNSFILAPVGSMGKAEWDRGWLYKRVEEEE